MNNKYYFQRCPALVNNNRNFTSFVINSEMNREVKEKLKATDEHSYRKLLQQNAVQIIKDNEKEYKNNFPCNV